MTTGQGTNALEFFESSSERLLSGLQKTTVMYCEDGESKSSLNLGEELINVQQQYPVETILHSKFESNGQQKYLIRWTGDHKDSWQPKGNITSDVIEDFNKRKVQERANKHLAIGISVLHSRYTFCYFCFAFMCHSHWIHFFFVN